MAHYQLAHLLQTAGMAFNYSFCLLAQELTQHSTRVKAGKPVMNEMGWHLPQGTSRHGVAWNGAPPWPYSRGFPGEGDGPQGLLCQHGLSWTCRGFCAGCGPCFSLCSSAQRSAVQRGQLSELWRSRAGGTGLLCLALAFTSLEGHLMQTGR